VENEELKNKDDFTVVLQSFTEDLKFPLNRFNTTDTTYLASDCFHFSQKGYARGENDLKSLFRYKKNIQKFLVFNKLSK